MITQSSFPSHRVSYMLLHLPVLISTLKIEWVWSSVTSVTTYKFPQCWLPVKYTRMWGEACETVTCASVDCLIHPFRATHRGSVFCTYLVFVTARLRPSWKLTFLAEDFPVFFQYRQTNAAKSPQLNNNRRYLSSGMLRHRVWSKFTDDCR
jgi:hypothetical protein